MQCVILNPSTVFVRLLVPNNRCYDTAPVRTSYVHFYPLCIQIYIVATHFQFCVVSPIPSCVYGSINSAGSVLNHGKLNCAGTCN